MDFINGLGPAPLFVVSLIKRLPDTSMTHALANGGVEYFGWGVDRHLAADIYDAINQGTRATGNWSKSPPNIPPWPRPERAKQKEERKPVTVAQLYNRFQKR